MKLTVLMPMGGLGKRFKDAGYTTPKPLIDIDGMPMFLRALESFPLSWEIEYIFIIRADQDRQYKLGEIIKDRCVNASIVVLESDTRGAVQTCLAAKKIIDTELPIIIMDCDIRFTSKQYITEVEKKALDGLLVGFSSHDSRYSYAEIDADSRVIRTAEKVPISNHALLGGYWFKSGRNFISLADRFTSAPLPNGLKEYYLSHLFNMLLEEGCSVGFAEADSFDIWGTPEELIAYKARKG